MTEHDNVNVFIAAMLQVPVREYTLDFDLAWELISDATMVNIAGQWYCKIEDIEWDGSTQPTKALAVCDTILRSRGLDLGVWR